MIVKRVRCFGTARGLRPAAMQYPATMRLTWAHLDLNIELRPTR